MLELIRDAPVGQIIRFATGNKVLQYPEEKVRDDDAGNDEGGIVVAFCPRLCLKQCTDAGCHPNF